MSRRWTFGVGEEGHVDLDDDVTDEEVGGQIRP